MADAVIKSVHERLQAVRTDLQKVEMKKSGKNGFANYSYFELADFLPLVNELCAKHRITPAMSFTPQEATLTLVNQDDVTDTLEFKMPFMVCEMKGQNRIQCLGSAITYSRRYMYMTVFEIVESDGIDSLSAEQKEEVKPVDQGKLELINKIKANVKNEKVAKKLVEVLKTSDAKKVDDLPTEKLSEIISVID